MTRAQGAPAPAFRLELTRLLRDWGIPASKASLRRKVFEQEEAWILQLRRERNFDAPRIQ